MKTTIQISVPKRNNKQPHGGVERSCFLIHLPGCYITMDWLLIKLREKYYGFFGKWFELRGISYLFGVIVRVKINL